MAFGHQKLTVAGTAAGLTVPQDCNYAIMSVETGAMRVRVDGTSPTASIGFLVSAGQELKVFGSDQLNNLIISLTKTIFLEINLRLLFQNMK